MKKQKNTKNIPLLIKLKTVLNDPTIKLDTKEQQIKLFKDQNINRVIMYNLLNQYKMIIYYNIIWSHLILIKEYIH